MNIFRYPEKIPCDKRLHALMGMVVIAVGSVFTLSITILLVVLFIVAYGIEFSQKIFKWGTYDNMDAVAVMLGGLITMLPLIVRGL